MVSLITPSFNSSQYIEETYQSILRQSDPNWEWIIVDDGSTDNTLELLGKYAASETRIRFYQRTVLPKGATTCRNIAVQMSKGEYLIFLDTDDVLASFCVEQRARTIAQNPECDFIVFQMMLFNEKVDDLRLLWNLEDGGDDLERAIRLNPVMAGSSTIWKKDSFIKIGLWDDQILINQDIELHIRSITAGLKYSLQLQLPPDLFVRNNQQSISRARKKPVEKQLSRVYYFQQVYGHLQTHLLNEKYQSALNWLFLKLFFDLSFDKNASVAAKLYQENPAVVKHLSLHYIVICKLIQLLGKNGFVIVGLIRFSNRSIAKLFQRKTHTFGQVKFEGALQL